MRSRGFTLVELLVALVVMAMLAVLSWRGLDGMARAQEQTRARADQVQALQVGLSQFAADLDSLVQLPQASTIDWNGRVLRLVRQAPPGQQEGLVVVGWARRVVGGAGRWVRWQSPLVTTRGAQEEAWLKADAWARDQAADATANEVAITGLDDWQVFYFRADAWTNPLSSDATQGAPSMSPNPAAPGAPGGTSGTRAAQIPDGVRIVLALSGGQAISGNLTRDWVRPTVGGGKS